MIIYDWKMKNRFGFTWTPTKYLNTCQTHDVSKRQIQIIHQQIKINISFRFCIWLFLKHVLSAKFELFFQRIPNKIMKIIDLYNLMYFIINDDENLHHSIHRYQSKCPYPFRFTERKEFNFISSSSTKQRTKEKKWKETDFRW